MELVNPTAADFYADFRCFRGCDGSYPLDEVIYNCPHCGGLLEVVHRLSALRQTPTERWKEVFRSRVGATDWPYGSGVWSKKEFVHPGLEDKNIVSAAEGNTNMFWAELQGEDWGVPDLWIKQCGKSHTGSFKDLGMTVLVSNAKQMRARGKNIRAVACGSTGDTSAALSAFAAMARIPAIVFLPRVEISDAQGVQPPANGAITLSFDQKFDYCMKLVQEVAADMGLYLANSKNSIRLEGQKTVAFEICEQFNWQVPDFIVIPSGNLGNVSAFAKGFWMLRILGLIDRFPRLVCAQAKAADPFYQAYLTGFCELRPVEVQSTLATAIAIGNPVSYEKAVRAMHEFNGIVGAATEQELQEARAEADRAGLLTCPQTGVALAVTKKLVREGKIPGSARVVVISTADGLKFTDSTRRYHEGRLTGIESRLANPTIEVAADVRAIEDALLRALDKRETELARHAI